MNEGLRVALADKDIDKMTGEEINDTYDKVIGVSSIVNGEPTPEEGKLTSEQAKAIINTANESFVKDPDAVLMDKIEKGEIKLDSSDLKTKEGYAVIDPSSGKVKQVIDNFGGDDIDIDSLINDDIGDIEDVIVEEDNIRHGLTEAYGIEEIDTEEVFILLDLVKRFNDGDTRIKYNDLPTSIKTKIANTIIEKSGRGLVYTGTKDLKDRMAREFISELAIQSLSDKVQDVFVDLGNTISNYTKKELSKSLTDITYSHATMFKEKFPEFAEKAEKEGKIKEAQQLRDVSAAYDEACTLNKMYDIYENTGKLRVKKFDIEKPQKLYQSIRDKYAHTKLTIRDVAMLEPILDRHLPEYIDMDDIKAFLVIFCKYCMNFNPSNIAEHTFMYYFVYNICILDMCDETNEESMKLKENTINTIVKFITLIRKKMGKE